MKSSKAGDVLQYVLLWSLLAAVVFWLWRGGSPQLQKPSLTSTPMPTASPAAEELSAEAEPKEDRGLVGLWVPYYELSADSEEAFKENYERICEEAQEKGVNTLFVHIRPFCDALYESSLYPSSHLLGGEQGSGWSFDPMEFMLEECHRRDMEFHAWINPLRVASKTIPGEFAEDSPYTLLKESNPYYFIHTESGVYLNPAYAYVRKLVADGAGEIAGRYKVDGIHFDDYFYPHDMGSQDELAYMDYVERAASPLSLEEWRCANINTMISESYRAIKRVTPGVSFGISPQGNMNNNYDLGADVAAWCQAPGYIDYICPQIYFSFENGALGFRECLDSWLALPRHSGLKLYVGLALYKVGSDSDGGTWSEDDTEIKNQIEEIERAKANGYVYFDSSVLEKLS